MDKAQPRQKGRPRAACTPRARGRVALTLLHCWALLRSSPGLGAPFAVRAFLALLRTAASPPATRMEASTTRAALATRGGTQPLRID